MDDVSFIRKPCLSLKAVVGPCKAPDREQGKGILGLKGGDGLHGGVQLKILL